MLLNECMNQPIMEALVYCGHGSKILIADGNYPLREKSGNAAKVYLALHRDQPTVIDVLHTLRSAVAFELAEVMAPENGPEPEIFAEFREELGFGLKGLDRHAFYAACMAPNAVMLAISTGETRTYANILLTVACA